ncbi:MAG: hypothetical protein WAL84_13655 [Candidatus Dormiibacterota bacterium]
MADDNRASYNDGRIVCDDGGLLIKWYYLWGAKRIPYSALKGVSELPLTGASKVRRWRLWGSGDFLHWWNLDPERPHKSMALVLDTGHHIRPTITPHDPGSVEGILRAHIQAPGD